MNVTIAMDSFKGSLTSLEAGYAIKKGIKNVYPDAIINVRPLADGGEGTTDVLISGMGGEWVQLPVTGPAGKKVDCRYGILKESGTAIMEMSSAAGITLVSGAERNPMNTTTYGVGEMICDAIQRGCRKFIIGIGGSATNDVGIGMLQALGYDFLDKEGKQVPFGAKGLAVLEKITKDNVIPELSECTFKIACDVANPLCGEKGCSAVFAPQKGATSSMVLEMNQWLERYADLAKEMFPKADPNHAGAGAAGGLGFAFLTFTNAVLQSGIEIVLEETNLKEYVKESDIVITGEGLLDAQTAMGKAPIGVARLAKKYQKTVIAFSGGATKDADICNEAGIDAFFPILRNILTLEEAMKKEVAAENLTETAKQVFRVIERFLRKK